jgi:hypothetical protein
MLVLLVASSLSFFPISLRRGLRYAPVQLLEDSAGVLRVASHIIPTEAPLPRPQSWAVWTGTKAIKMSHLADVSHPGCVQSRPY